MDYEYLVIVEGSRPEQLTEQFTHKSSYRIAIEDLRPVIAEGFAHFTVLEVVEQAEPGTKVGRLRAKRRTTPTRVESGAAPETILRMQVFALTG